MYALVITLFTGSFLYPLGELIGYPLTFVGYNTHYRLPLPLGVLNIAVTVLL